MVQLNTIYDKTLKEKIFILKGEEGYARSTDCILDEILHDGERRSDWDTHIDHMLLEFRVDVLRDIGASSVVLYDDDKVLGSYPLDTNSHHIDFKYEDQEHDNRLSFDYGVEHNLYAKYMGNKKCLKSKSKIYTFQEETPQAYTSSLEFIDLSGSYETGNLEFSIKLIGEEGFDGKTIKLYDGSTLLGDYITDSTGIANANLTGLTDGVHTITAIFQGDEYLTYAELSQEVSIGYEITVDVLNSVLNEVDLIYTATVTDYHNNLISNYSLNTYGRDGSNLGETKTTDDFGVALFSIPYEDYSRSTSGYEVIFYCKSEHNSSSLVTVPFYTHVEITNFTSDKDIIAPNITANVTGTVQGVRSPVEVALSYNDSRDLITTTVITDQNGNFSYNLQGSGEGLVELTATIPNYSKTLAIEDVLQLWDKNNSMTGIFYYEDSGTVRSEINGWRFSPTNNISRIYFGQTRNQYRYESALVEFKVVSTSGITKINGMPITLSANDVIRIETNRFEMTITLYKNGEGVGLISKGSIETKLEFESNNGYILLDKLKFRRLW